MGILIGIGIWFLLGFTGFGFHFIVMLLERKEFRPVGTSQIVGIVLAYGCMGFFTCLSAFILLFARVFFKPNLVWDRNLYKNKGEPDEA